MTLQKKHIKYQKTLKIFTNNPIIMFYHYNNINTKYWRLMKNECSKIGALETLVVKNRIARNFIQFTKENAQKQCFLKKDFLKKKNNYFQTKSTLQKKIDFSEEKSMLALLQGPSFVIGCQSIDQLARVYKTLNKLSNFIFIGSVIESDFFNKKTANTQKNLHSNHKAEKQINDTIQNSSKIYTHLDVEKLIQLDSSIYIELIQTLQSSAYSLFSVLNKPHYTIISLLNLKKK
jgi:ribosomal protein L10